MEKRSTVAVLPVEASVQETVGQVMELAHWKNYIVQGKPALLKVNLGWDLFIPGSITSPWVIEGVMQTIREWVGQLYLVESDQVLENVEKVFRKCRLQELCNRYDATWINMSQEDTIRLEVNGGKVFSYLEIPRILNDFQIVTIPVMKTHAKTKITGAIKNQWGCISKLRHNYHLVLSDALADINSVVRPVFAVMDATIALEGNGPKSGAPKFVNRILASHDLVALDTVQAKMMGIDPDSIPHLSNCAQRCIGTNRLEQIEIVGEREAADLNLSFRPAKHNLVSWIEEHLRRSRWKWLFFDTPVFHLMIFGAKVWYWIWCHFVKGKRCWETVLQHPFYGKEWEEIAKNGHVPD